MKPKSGVQKSNPRVSLIETKWRSVLDLFDVSKPRRGKAMEKQGLVVDLSISGNSLTAKIQGPKMRFAPQDVFVTLPLMDGGRAVQSDIAHLLYQRPDWLGALLSGEWNREFWDALTNMGLQWYPSESSAWSWLSGVTCTCRDPEMPCFHAAAALFAVLREMDEHPLFALRFLGIQEDELLSEAHRIGSTKPVGDADLNQQRLANSQGSAAFDANSQRSTVFDTESLGPTTFDADSQRSTVFDNEEEAVYQKTSQQGGEHIRHRLPPNWDEEKRTAWRERYMAWK